jgi:cutinase
MAPLLATTVAIAILTILPSLTTAQQKCTGQSCGIANLSGSTGAPIEIIAGGPKLSGGSATGTKCIDQWLTKLNVPHPPLPPPSRRSRIEGRQQTTCKPYTLLYARGTFEFGALGLTVGPQIKSALEKAQPGKWDIKGIEYNNDMSGNDCVGLPGGMKCLDVLKSTAAQCPDTKFVVSGYSQGAMVAHNCVAYAEEAIKSRVKGVVVFGDPFNGAPIKGFPSERLKIFCNAGDGVCDGKFAISAAHMSYGGTIGEATKAMQQFASR